MTMRKNQNSSKEVEATHIDIDDEKLKRKAKKISHSDCRHFKSFIAAMTTTTETFKNDFVFINNFSHLNDSIKKSHARKLFAYANLFNFVKCLLRFALSSAQKN